MKKYLYPLNAVHKSGFVFLLYSLEEVHDFIRKYGRFYEKRVSCHTTWNPYTSVLVINDWIVRDDRGQIVKYDDIPSLPYSGGWWIRKQEERKAAAEKGLPIPGTRKRRWHKMNHQRKKNGGKGVRNKVQQSKEDFADWKYGR
jgi:hypothetical protein